MDILVENEFLNKHDIAAHHPSINTSDIYNNFVISLQSLVINNFVVEDFSQIKYFLFYFEQFFNGLFFDALQLIEEMSEVFEFRKIFCRKQRSYLVVKFRENFYSCLHTVLAISLITYPMRIFCIYFSKQDRYLFFQILHNLFSSFPSYYKCFDLIT